MIQHDIVLDLKGAPNFPARYEAIREVARGGMGAVWQVRDRNLDRDLAAKVLLPRTAGLPALVTRFLGEAKITALLQHPGVPPVVERGELADGSPFFTMKLVEGETLAAVLERRAETVSEQPQLLAVFDQVAQTLAFAHRRGVVHRDLKPLNVMVGAFGEVQVMDWGFAKVADREIDLATIAASTSLALTRPVERQQFEDAPLQLEDTVIGTPGNGGGSTLAEDINDDGHLTRAGEVMGTFAYMSPEQARGDHDHLDARADVFSLGAMLCEILTGGPPYTGANRWHQAREADLAPALARLGCCGADPELLTLTRECLAADPARRPADAGEVAGRVSAYRSAVEQRLRTAERERAVAEAKAVEERKRRRLAIGLAAAVVALLAVGGAAGWRYREVQLAEAAAEANRKRELRADVSDALARAAELRDESRWAASRTLLEGAERRLSGSGAPDLRQQVGAAQRDVAVAEELEEIRMRKVGDDRGMGTLHAQGPDGAYAAAFRLLGIDVIAGDTETAARQIVALQISRKLIGALDHWTIHETDQHLKGRLLEIARAADPDPKVALLRDPAFRGDEASLRAYAAEADPIRLGPEGVAVAVELLKQTNGHKIAATLLARGLAHFPSDVWLNFEAARLASRDKARLAEAVGLYRTVLVLRPEAPAVHVNLALALTDLGRQEEAEAEFRAALRLRPKYFLTHLNLARLLEKSGRSDEAAIHSAKAEDEIQRLIKLYPRDSDLPTRLGLLLLDRGRPVDAIAYLRLAAQLNAKSYEARDKLGWALLQTGQLEESEEAYRDAIQIRTDFAPAHFGLGMIFERQSRRSEAETAYREAVRLDPQYDMAWWKLGWLMIDSLRLDEAETTFREAMQENPSNPDFQRALGSVLQRKGDLEGALVEFQEAARRDPSVTYVWNDMLTTLIQLGRIAQAEELLAEADRLGPRDDSRLNTFAWQIVAHEPVSADAASRAVVVAERAVMAAPSDPDIRNTLGVALYRTRKWQRAVDTLDEAIRLRGTTPDPGDHLFLAMALHELGTPDKARRAYQVGVSLMEPMPLVNEDLRLFRAEAEQVLGISAVRAPVEAVRPEHSR